MAKQIKLRRDQQKARKAQLQGESEPLTTQPKTSDNTNTTATNGCFLLPPTTNRPKKRPAPSTIKSITDPTPEIQQITSQPDLTLSSMTKSSNFYSTARFDLGLALAQLSPSAFPFHPSFGGGVQIAGIQQPAFASQQQTSPLSSPILPMGMTVLPTSLPSPTPLHPFDGIKALIQPLQFLSHQTTSFSALGAFPFNLSNLLFDYQPVAADLHSTTTTATKIL